MKRIQIYIFDERVKKNIWSDLDLQKDDYILYQEGEEKYFSIVLNTIVVNLEEINKQKFEINKEKNNENEKEKKDEIENENKDKNKEEISKIIKKLSDDEVNYYFKIQFETKEIFKEILEEIEKQELDLNLFDVLYNYENTKLKIYYTAEERVDFREFVKILANKYKKRIEMIQLTNPEETKRDGGFGKCGREICCASFLQRPINTSIKMAKEQGLALNNENISGKCGKLMCCLNFENCVYEEKNKYLPKVGSKIETEDGIGEVTNVQTLKEMVRVKITDKETDESYYKNYKYDELKNKIEDKVKK